MATNIAKIGSLTEYTSVVNPIELIPAKYGIMSALGLFTAESLNTDSVIIPRIQYSAHKMTAVRWGTAVKNQAKEAKGYLTLQIPHYAEEDAILPRDIRGKFQWEDIVATERKESVQALFARKMRTMTDAATRTWDAAFIQLVRDGTAVRDDLGNLYNYYTEFGETRVDVTMTLSDETIDPMPKIQEAIDAVVDNFRGGYIPTRFVCLAERTLFDSLARHPYTVDSYKYIEQNQSVAILNQKLATGGMNLDDRYTTLEMGGVTFIRVDSNEMTVGEGRLFPVDIPDLFKVFFAPSEKNFAVVDSIAQSAYYWEETTEKEVHMEVESNFLPVLMWPKAVVRIVRA